MMPSGLISAGKAVESGAEIYGAASSHKAVKHGKQADSSEDDIENLFDGSLDTTVSGGAYENVKIHMDKVMEVDSVSVYAVEDNDTLIDSFDVYASMDGESFDFVASFENNSEQASYELEKYTLKMPGSVYAKALKVVIKATEDAGELEVAEIEAYGRPAQIAAERVTSYSYETDVPFVTGSDIIAADPDCTALSDGAQAQISTAGDYVSIIYDLGGFRQVDSIKVKGNHGGMELLTSPDGINYFSSAYYANSGGETVAYGRSENNAKFAKLVFKKPTGANIFLSEIELYARKLPDLNKQDGVPVRVTLKPNNIAYIDWSDYGANDAQGTYNVYIEKNDFTSTAGLTPKGVLLGGSGTRVTDVAANFAMYSGFEPEATYYIGVSEKGADNIGGTVRVDTYSVTGGEELSSIFCLNEFDGGSNVYSKSKLLAYHNTGYSWITEWANGKVPLWSDVTEADLASAPEANDGAKVSKLLTDLEVVNKNRYWSPSESHVNSYAAKGISMRYQGAQSNDMWDTLTALGVYDSEYRNEPDGSWNNLKSQTDKDAYIKDYLTNYKEYYNRVKAHNPKISVSGPTLMGIGNNIGNPYTQDLFEEDSKYGDYVDVWDFHMYCKIGEKTDGTDVSGTNRDDLGGENGVEPEYILNKMELLYGKGNLIPSEYRDKDMISSETGWTSALNNTSCAARGGQKPVDEETKAEYVARMYLVGAMAGVSNIYLYSFQDEGYLTPDEVAAGKKYVNVGYRTDPSDNTSKRYITLADPCHEHMFGIVDWYGNPKEGYYAYYTLGKVLKNADYVKQLTMPSGAYGAVFYDKAKDKYVTALWEITGNGKTVSVKSDESSLMKIGMYGDVTTMSPGAVKLTTAPIYVYSDEPITVESSVRTVISGNGVGNSDNNVVATYAKLGLDVELGTNTATYTMTNSDNPDRDPSTWLRQGVLGASATSGNNCIWTEFYKNTTEIVIDLGKSFSVNGVDASAYSQSTSMDFSKIKVEVSTNGTDYKTVVAEKTLVDGENAYVISGETSGQYERLSVNSFAPVTAQYVKVTLTGGTHQVVPNEVLVFGK